MSRLGSWGRFANQIFQYAFLKIYTQKNNFRLETSPWIGQYLFGHKDPPVSQSFPSINDVHKSQDPYDGSKSRIAGAKDPPRNTDLVGYFQYHTSFYAPYRDLFRSLFKPIPAVERVVRKSVDVMKSRGNTVIGFHLRRGDYGTFVKPGSKCFFVTPTSWCLDWLRENWSRFDNPVLFIASDELPKVIGDFREYSPVTNESLGIRIPQALYYPDFYTLSQCDVMCIANSSFSFAASMLNEKCTEFYRPRLSLKEFIPYNPWNDHTIFRDEEY
jgi:hypothetical protein